MAERECWRCFERRERLSGTSLVGPEGLEPPTKGLCYSTSAFAAPFGFVVWTFSSLYGSPIKSLHLPVIALGDGGLGSGLAYRLSESAFPEFERFYLATVRWDDHQATHVEKPFADHSAGRLQPL